MARALFPHGLVPQKEAGESDSSATTRCLSGLSDGVIFEATFETAGVSARVDILEVTPSEVRVIEIKAKSYSSLDGPDFFDKKGNLRTEWKEYIYDIAFQVFVVQLSTGRTATPILCLVDTAKTATNNSTFDKIRLRDRGNGDKSQLSSDYVGDASQLKTDHVLAFVEVSEPVRMVMSEIESWVEALRGVVGSNHPPHVELSTLCRSCEYRTDDTERNGFRDCWGELAKADNHVLDLYHASSPGTVDVVEECIKEGRVNLVDFPVTRIDGTKARGGRQIMQVEAATSGRELFTDSLRSALRTAKFPLHFVDFETSRIPIPYHAGMRPYEQVIFQFSVHTIESETSESLVHREWINSEDVYPGLEFAKELRSAIGETGTVLVWSPFEQTAMRELAEQATRYDLGQSDLVNWLLHTRESVENGGRVLDLLKVCEKSYCHPLMGGSLSVKKVLAAVWHENSQLRDHPWFEKYKKFDSAGNLLDPYESLGVVPYGFEAEFAQVEAQVVREGVGAMRAYQEMLFGLHSSDSEFKMRTKKHLLQYCELDTAAMVIVWKHWESIVG